MRLSKLLKFINGSDNINVTEAKNGKTIYTGQAFYTPFIAANVFCVYVKSGILTIEVTKDN